MADLRVVVSVRRSDEKRGRDLAMPAEVPLAELQHDIAKACGWLEPDHVQYRVWANPPRRELPLSQSLADSGVWDGASLLFTPIPESALPDGTCFLQLPSGSRHVLVSSPLGLGRGPMGTRADQGLAAWLDLGSEPGGKTISRFHAMLVEEDGNWTLTVEKSALNPTYCGQDLVPAGSKRLLREGDWLQLGDVKLRFRQSVA